MIETKEGIVSTFSSRPGALAGQHDAEFFLGEVLAPCESLCPCKNLLQGEKLLSASTAGEQSFLEHHKESNNWQLAKSIWKQLRHVYLSGRTELIL